MGNNGGPDRHGVTMKKQSGGEATIICDECECEVHQGTSTFRQFIDDLKEDGWKIRPDEDGGWSHICPDCVEE